MQSETGIEPDMDRDIDRDMDRHRLASLIAGAALVLGIAGDLLLRWVPWGVNALLWTALLCIAARVCASASEPHRRPGMMILACAILAAAGLLWRDSDVLVTLDVLLLLLFLPMLALGARGVRVHAAGAGEIAVAVLMTGAQSIAGVFQLIGTDVSWNRIPRAGSRRLGIAARGTLIAAPALVVFGSLLASADPEFGKILTDLIVFDPGEAFLHLFVIAFVTALCAGFLRSLTFSGPIPRPDEPGPPLWLPAPETNFALGLVNLLFALFVAVQFRYFFGSAPVDFAQYARRGFFELAWVVALVVPMLLLLEWLIRKDQGAAMFRGLAMLQVALVLVMAGSAFHRMKLYRDEFGLTRLRFFTSAFIIWVAVLLVWFVLTVLTGRRQRFAIGALASGMAVVVALHAINPDRIIVETNIERARAGRRAFDARYALTLSDDATPAILANADVVTHEVVSRNVWKRRPVGWRTWNVSRAAAREAARRHYESNATPPIGRGR